MNVVLFLSFNDKQININKNQTSIISVTLIVQEFSERYPFNELVHAFIFILTLENNRLLVGHEGLLGSVHASGN